MNHSKNLPRTQQPWAQQRREALPHHSASAGQPVIRKFPIFAALMVVTIVPMYIFNYMPTSFEHEQLTKIRTSHNHTDTTIATAAATTTTPQDQMIPPTTPRMANNNDHEVPSPNTNTLATTTDYHSTSLPQSRPNSYTGTPWISDRTVSKQIVAETPFARCEFHTVQSEDGSDSVNDWLFMEEKDAINAVVVNSDGNFVVFRQQKYAIPGMTLSPVGGFIDDGETPYMSAQREVLEELGMASVKQMEEMKHENTRKLQHPTNNNNTPQQPDNNNNNNYDATLGRITDGDPDWVYLGMYRTSSNRGGGFLYSYLLKNAVPVKENGGTNHYLGTGDNEQQQILHLTPGQIQRAVSTSQFKEIKWAATVSLSLLHLQNGMGGNT